MSAVTIELPDSVKRNIEALAARDGCSVSQFVVKAATEKIAAIQGLDFLRSEAAAGRREAFESFLAAVPAVEPAPEDRVD